MAAQMFTGNQSQNFYTVSYGYLTSKVKEIPEGFSEISVEELKSKATNVENLDLRQKYVKSSSENYPYAIFYDSISGRLDGLESEETNFGKVLKLSLTDSDGESSSVSMKFYSKYAENILNRLCNLDGLDNITLSPYAIPADMEVTENGKPKRVKYYNQGISLYRNKNKIAAKYTYESTEIPKSERVKNHDGKMVTSRVNRIDALVDIFNTQFAKLKESSPVSEPAFVEASSNSDDDLPF